MPKAQCYRHPVRPEVRTVRAALYTLPCGAALLLFDWVARVALRPQTLPVGVVTALVGGVFFLGILLRARRGPGWM